jgi:SAM-dependent methyltransferase
MQHRNHGFIDVLSSAGVSPMPVERQGSATTPVPRQFGGERQILHKGRDTSIDHRQHPSKQRGLLAAMSKAAFREILGAAVRIPAVRAALTAFHLLRHRRHPYVKRHPFDKSYGTDTSGFMPPWLLRTGAATGGQAGAYVGCQPSCFRRAVEAIPRAERYAFIDLGCGKGRALVLASERPFRRIVGVELAPALVRVARRNAERVGRSHPERTRIEVVLGDATAVPFLEGDLVIFLYQPFGPQLITRTLDRIAAAVATENRQAFVIYENPVHADLVDNAPGFGRVFSDAIPCTASESGYSPDDVEPVIVWRAGQTSGELPTGNTVTGMSLSH